MKTNNKEKKKFTESDIRRLMGLSEPTFEPIDMGDGHILDEHTLSKFEKEF
jgi:hypothetical protein